MGMEVNVVAPVRNNSYYYIRTREQEPGTQLIMHCNHNEWAEKS